MLMTRKIGSIGISYAPNKDAVRFEGIAYAQFDVICNVLLWRGPLPSFFLPKGSVINILPFLLCANENHVLLFSDGVLMVFPRSQTNRFIFPSDWTWPIK